MSSVETNSCPRGECPRHKTLNEDNTYSLHVTAPLQKHFVVGRFATLNFFRFGYFLQQFEGVLNSLYHNDTGILIIE